MLDLAFMGFVRRGRAGGRRERLADRAEVAAAGLHRVAAAAQQRFLVAGLGRGRLGRVEAGRGRVDPSEEILRRHPAEGSDPGVVILGELGHQAEAPLVDCAVAASAAGAGVGAAARTTAMSTLSMAALVNGKGGREVASIG